MFRRVSEDGIFLVYCSIKQSKKMTSVKVKFRASRVPGKAGCVFYQVIHARVVRQIRTNFHLFTDEWDCCQGNVVAVSPDILPVRANYLNDVRAKIRRDCLRLNSVVEDLVRQGRAFTVDDIVARYVARKSELSFFHFMYDVTVQLSRLGRERTSETYATTLRSFKAFRMGVDVPVDEITPELMLYYEAYLRNRGLAMNTISFYMRILRAVYNRAVEQGLTPQRHPFKPTYTGIARTTKRAVALNVVKRIKALDLPPHSSLDLARDLFLFSFYTRGMSFVDMAYLRKSDLRNGVLTYRRRKTGQRLTVKWERCMQQVVDKYAPTQTDYLLPIIRPTGNPRRHYQNALHLVNVCLHSIGERIGLSSRLTMYVARHTWASVARSKHIPISVISEGMGHDSEATTQIYLASLDHSVVDRANAMILRGL